MGKESELEGKLKSKTESMFPGIMCLKFSSPGCSGVPDRLILLPGGKAVFVEMKAPGKKERSRQEFIQKKIRSLGFEVFSAVKTTEKINEVVDRCKVLIDSCGGEGYTGRLDSDDKES